MCVRALVPAFARAPIHARMRARARAGERASGAVSVGSFGSFGSVHLGRLIRFSRFRFIQGEVEGEDEDEDEDAGWTTERVARMAAASRAAQFQSIMCARSDCPRAADCGSLCSICLSYAAVRPTPATYTSACLHRCARAALHKHAACSVLPGTRPPSQACDRVVSISCMRGSVALGHKTVQAPFSLFLTRFEQF